MFRILVLWAVVWTGWGLWAQTEASKSESTTSGLATVNGRPVLWEDRNGWAVAGDIIIARTSELLETKTDTGKAALLIRNENRRWPNNTVPFVIHSSVARPAEIQQAVDAWNSRTPFKLIPRTTESSYVQVRGDDSGCYANVGRVGGVQLVNVASGCGLGATIHEFGHAIGIYHTQARQDRDFYIRVEYDNIEKENWSQYDLEPGAFDFGPYDYSSIMHYSSGGFNAAPAPTIKTLPAGIPVGQRSTLSIGDVAAARRIAGTTNGTILVDSNPSGLRIVVDGEEITGPREFDWAEGSVHSLGIPEGPQAGTIARTRNLFARWSDNGPNTHSITVNRSEAGFYIANFAQQYQLPVSAGAGGQARVVNPSADGWYNLESEVTVEAIPDAGFRFANWDNDSAGYFGTLGNAQNPHRIPLLSSIHTLNATFTQGPITRINSNQPQTRVNIDGRAYALPSQFAWAPNTPHNLEAPALVSDSVQINGVDYVSFNSWSGGTAIAGSLGRGVTVTATGEDQNFSANFTRWGRFIELRSGNPSSWGSFSAQTPGQRNISGLSYYPAGTSVLMRADLRRPDAVFLGWGFDLAGTDLAQSLIVNSQTMVTARFGLRGNISTEAVTNAASYQASSVAPGEIVTLFGTDIGPEVPAFAAVGSNGRLLTEVAGTRVNFDGIPAPIIYLGANQISVIAPYALADKADGGFVTIEVTSPGRTVLPTTITKQSAIPGIFTANASGGGNCACLNQDGRVNSATNPAPKGSVVVLYTTGEGAVTPAVADGTIASGAAWGPMSPVRVMIGGRNAIVDYAGAAPGLAAGVMQVNFRVPPDMASGNVPIQMIVGNVAGSNRATVAVQ
jgi:uncharacterized protein (TIGR03437 family)